MGQENSLLQSCSVAQCLYRRTKSEYLVPSRCQQPFLPVCVISTCRGGWIRSRIRVKPFCWIASLHFYWIRSHLFSSMEYGRSFLLNKIPFSLFNNMRLKLIFSNWNCGDNTMNTELSHWVLSGHQVTQLTTLNCKHLPQLCSFTNNRVIIVIDVRYSAWYCTIITLGSDILQLKYCWESENYICDLAYFIEREQLWSYSIEREQLRSYSIERQGRNSIEIESRDFNQDLYRDLNKWDAIQSTRLFDFANLHRSLYLFFREVVVFLGTAQLLFHLYFEAWLTYNYIIKVWHDRQVEYKISRIQRIVGRWFVFLPLILLCLPWWDWNSNTEGSVNIQGSKNKISINMSLKKALWECSCGRCHKSQLPCLFVPLLVYM